MKRKDAINLIKYAGYHNDTTGAGDEGDFNIYLGYQAGFGATGATTNTGYYNACIGPKAGYYLTSGFKNFFLGGFAGYQTTTGNNCVFIGSSAGR